MDKVPCTPCYGRGWNYAAEGKTRRCEYCDGTGQLGPEPELPDPAAEAARLATDPEHRRRKAAWIRTQAEQRGRASNPALYDARMRRATELDGK